MIRTFRPLFLLAALLALGRVAVAHPDPIGERQKPSLQQKAPPAPPPARPGGTASDTGGMGVRTATGASASGATPGTESGPAATTAGPRALGSDDGSYKLGPRDMLRVEVWNRAEIEYEWRPVTVAEEGTINLPLLEDVSVVGLTVDETKEKLRKLYDGFIIGPQVFIQMQEYNSRQVSVLGEVNNPGRYSLKGALTLTDLLAEAGDLSKKASATVRLIRQRPDSETPEVRDIDLSLLQAGDNSQNVHILPDDVVTVLPNRNVVYVTGMVKGEGYVEYEEGLTAQQAIILAGGLADGSAGGRAKVYRVEGGQTTHYKVDVKNQRSPFPLKPGDIIHVPRSIL